MKNKYLLLIVVVVSYFLASCSDEFLVAEPINSSTEETFYQTDEQMYSALMAAYSPLQWGTIFGSTVVLGEIRSDNAKTGGGGDGDAPALQSIENFSNDEVNEISDKHWWKNYSGIYRANLVINAEYTSEITKVYKAEALFLRAWYHFDLLRIYGPCPISLESKYPTDYDFVRNSRQEVYDQIEKDLLEAINALKDKHDPNELGRITKTAAQALLGKMYIYQACWNNNNPVIFNKAIVPLEGVINSNQYKLFDDYSQLFVAHSENNSESIFEIQRSSTGGFNGNSDYDTGNHWTNYFGMRGLNGKHPLFDTGWGFGLPQRELWNYFLLDDTIRRNASALNYEEVVTQTNAQISNPKDYVVWDTLAINPVDWDGFAPKKYAPLKGYEFVGPKNKNRPGNERLIRYGEVYLLLAEAYLRGSQPNGEVEAKRLINELRTKRVTVLPGETSFYTVDDLMAKYPDRFNSTLDVLWYERRCELAGEGDRWYDLVRSQRAELVMGALYPDRWAAKHVYIPVGLNELGAAGGSLKAYPESE